jgi:hypothetical protein
VFASPDTVAEGVQTYVSYVDTGAGEVTVTADDVAFKQTFVLAADNVNAGGVTNEANTAVLGLDVQVNST